MIGGSFPELQEFFRSQYKYKYIQKTLSLFCLFFENLLTLERFKFISQKSSVNFNYFMFSQSGPLLILC